MATDMTPRFDELRCADQDRELVAQVLNNAYAEGRLTFDEHADRIAAAYDSRTFGDLDALTGDLLPRDPRFPTQSAPVPAPSAAPATPGPWGHAAPVVPGAYSGANAILSTHRSGRLGTVAQEVTVNAWLGDARIDLVGATFASRTTTVRVGVLMGEVKIRVPEGVTVNTSHLTNVMAETKVDGIVGHPDGMVVNVVGTVIMGEVTVLGPATSRTRRYERFVK